MDLSKPLAIRLIGPIGAVCAGGVGCVDQGIELVTPRNQS